MAWDNEYDPADYEHDTVGTKGHGEAWERLNNLVFEEWRRFNARLEEVAAELESLGKPPMTAARRSEHVSRFRQSLLDRYNLASVDPRWEAERAKRLDARNQQQTYKNKGQYAA